MSAGDSFTENDMRYFESVKDIIACDCNRVLWSTSFDLDTKKYRIKCLNCQKYLTLRDLYAVNLKTRTLIAEIVTELRAIKKAIKGQ